MTEQEFFDDIAKRPYVKMEELETDRDARRVLGAIATLVKTEKLIPACRTIDEVEELRASCNGIQHYDREHPRQLGANIVAWAKKCAVLCQLRITQIQEEQRARREGKQTQTESDVRNATYVAPQTEKNYKSEARLVASLAREELEEHLKTSGSIQLIARKVRKARKRPEPKSTPEQLEGARQRRIRAKQREQANRPPEPKLSPIDRFRRYWSQEEKLLRQFFIISDLSSIEKYWVRAFQAYCKEVEAGKRERDEALAKLKTAAANRKDPVAA